MRITLKQICLAETLTLTQKGTLLGPADGCYTRTFSSIRLPRWGSSGLEDGLNNLSWETGCYEVCPLMGHTHSFHNSGRGWKMVPPAWERRSRHIGISHRESSGRPTRSANHGWLGQYGATNNRLTLSRRTLSRTPGSRAIGGEGVQTKPRPRLCTIASIPSGTGLVRENQRGRCEVSRDANKSTWARPKLLPKMLHHLGV